MNLERRGAFTLVEIMIVVVIIGLLAVMAVPTWQKVRLDSQNKTISNNLRQLSAAAQQYFLEAGQDSVASASLIGSASENYIKNLATVRGEVYPATIAMVETQITATSAAGDVSYPP